MKTMAIALALACAVTVTAAAADYRVVDASDLYVAPGKYRGKDIEIKAVNCYYADVEDYRCITSSWASIFTKAIESETSRKFVEDNCDTLKKALAPRCKVTIRFNFDEASEDVASGYQKRIILRPDSVTVVVAERAKAFRR